jgi:hypothetical protein
MTDTLTRPYGYKFPSNTARTSNSASRLLSNSRNLSDPSSTIFDSQSTAIPIQQHFAPDSITNTLEQHIEQYLSHQELSHMQKPTNNCSASNLSYNMPYLLTAPHEQYYMVPSNLMSINVPPATCSSLLPELNTTFPSVLFSNNMKKARKKQANPRKSKTVQTTTEEVSMAEKLVAATSLTMGTPVVKRQVQKKSKTLIQRMKQKNKLTVLKYMIRKRKQQEQVSNKKLPEVKIEKVVPQTVETETKLTDIIASNLKITFNAAQKVDSISLHYHQRHKPEMKTEHTLGTPNSTENNLNLLIEAVKLIEMYNGSSKLALKSIK